jgi:hypothetical protein
MAELIAASDKMPLRIRNMMDVQSPGRLQNSVAEKVSRHESDWVKDD